MRNGHCHHLLLSQNLYKVIMEPQTFLKLVSNIITGASPSGLHPASFVTISCHPLYVSPIAYHARSCYKFMTFCCSHCFEYPSLYFSLENTVSSLSM